MLEVHAQLSKKNFTKGRSPSARTENQKTYIKAVIKNDIVICQGPAGTGKTHLAIGMGVWGLRKGTIDKIVIARPTIEAGEQIGFLPGDLEAKMNPFTRPCFDELKEYATYEEIDTWQKKGSIEICPIGFMRGRTLNSAFIICDECQNLSFRQMKMLLTRFGNNSKLVLTGDIGQSDLHKNDQGGFAYGCALAKYISDVYNMKIAIVKLESSDNQRHPLVQIIEEIWDNNLDKFKKSGRI